MILHDYKNQLDIEGVTFIPDELIQLDELFWNMMSTLNSNIDRNNRTTWNNKTFPGDFSTGICGYYGMPQSDYAWNIRLNNKIKSIFAYLHDIDTNDLCCSMDCLNIMFDYKNKQNHGYIETNLLVI